VFGVRSLAAAAAAAALAATGPALAETAVFKIDVTSATVQGFTPFSFDETFNLGPGGFYGSGDGEDQGSSGFVTGGSTPMTASLKSLADLTGATATSTFNFRNRPPSTEGDIDQDTSGPNGGYKQSIAVDPVDYSPVSIDEAGLVAFFAAQGDLPWYEEALGPGEEVLAKYSGTATLLPPVSGAPEPAAWALLLAGIGAVGAALRRPRRPVLA